MYEPGRVARIILNRPQYRNAQSAGLLEAADEAFRAAAADRSVRVIVLSGAGEAFSSGHDLGTPDQAAYWESVIDDKVTEQERRFTYSWDHFVDLSLRWRDLPKPTIAMVHGWCIFGGWLVASSMDLIVAADTARFMTAMLQYGPLPFDVGPRKAKQLLFDAHEISAAEAHELGFVNEVVPEDRLEAETLALAERIARNSPFYLRMAKLAVNNAQDAQGFRAAIQASHSHYHLSESADREWGRRRGGETGRRRLSLVDRMLSDGEDGGS